MSDKPRYTELPHARDVCKTHPPLWEENVELRQQLAEANATIARLHHAVSVARREKKHLG